MMIKLDVKKIFTGLTTPPYLMGKTCYCLALRPPLGPMRVRPQPRPYHNFCDMKADMQNLFMAANLIV